jgi:hypothetical protein
MFHNMQTNLKRTVIGIGVLLFVVATVCLAQRRGGRFRGMQESSGSLPVWSNDPEFEKDVFTFARIRYTSSGGGWGWGRGGNRWYTDAPDADLNFGFRLQQLTALKVYPHEKDIELTDPELFDHPFIYIVEPGALEFSEEEVKILRRYLLSGGFLMVDDFWGEREWLNLYEQMKRVFPEREATELSLEHPIFHCVFDLKEKPQIPNVGLGTESLDPNSPVFGVTWERPDARTVHYKGIFDDKGRMMVIICHNTDLGDGWEREGDNEGYFREFSEKRAYPLGINIIFYAMTH